MGDSLMWKMYRSKVHTKGIWGFGVSKGTESFTVDFAKWSFTIYKDDF